MSNPLLNTPEKQQIAGQIELLAEEILRVKVEEPLRFQNDEQWNGKYSPTDYLENQIDELVFGLYGLTAEEITIITK